MRTDTDSWKAVPVHPQPTLRSHRDISIADRMCPSPDPTRLAISAGVSATIMQ